jgi:hypothetical protein
MLVAVLWPLTLGHLLAMLVVILPFALLVAIIEWQRHHGCHAATRLKHTADLPSASHLASASISLVIQPMQTALGGGSRWFTA